MTKTAPIAGRWSVVSRTFAALFGGHITTAALAMAIARYVPLQTLPATLVAVLITPFLYAGTVLWSFTTRSALRAWLGLLGVAIIMGGLAMASIALVGRS